MDTVGNMITSLLNAGRAGKDAFEVPYSTFKHAIAKTLLEKGYIQGYKQNNKKSGSVLEIEVAYNEDGTPKVGGAKRVSKLSRRWYLGVKDIYSVRQGKGTLLLSTPKGILVAADAKKEHVGGEALFEIW